MKSKTAVDKAKRYSRIIRKGESCFIEIQPVIGNFEPYQVGPLTYPKARDMLKRARAHDALRLLNAAGPILSGQAIEWAINDQHHNDVYKIVEAARRWIEAWHKVVAKSQSEGFTVTNKNATKTTNAREIKRHA